MSDIDIKDFEQKIVLRQIESSDFDQVIDLQLKCFPKMKPWTREQFESQIKIFPEGQLCIAYEGKIAASSGSLIVDFDLHSEWHNWREIADSGFIRNHNPKADTLYGIEIMVHPEFRGMRLARRLYRARKELCQKLNLARIVIGGRIPGYVHYKDELTAREYADKVISKELIDSVLTTQISNGFLLQRLIPDYFPADLDSSGWATHLEWLNHDFQSDQNRRLSPVQVVRIATVQYEMRAIKSTEELAQQVEFFVDVAGDYRADFVVFPELFTLQLLSITMAPRPGIAARMMNEFTPFYLDLFTSLAVKYNVNIIGGSHFSTENDKLYNFGYLFRRDGTIEKQAKIHITPAERRWWGVVGGDQVSVFETDCGRVAINVCYDIEFPELARAAAKQGAHILFCPFNTDERCGYLRIRYCAQARCVENHLYVVTSGCVGNLPFVKNADIHYAQSGVYTPADIAFSREGVGAECAPNVETVVLCDLDIELLRRHRYKGTTQNWNDRRSDLYRIHFTSPKGDLII